MEGVDLSALDAATSEEEVWDRIKSLPANREYPVWMDISVSSSCRQLIKADFMAAIIVLQ